MRSTLGRANRQPATSIRRPASGAAVALGPLRRARACRRRDGRRDPPRSPAVPARRVLVHSCDHVAVQGACATGARALHHAPRSGPVHAPWWHQKARGVPRRDQMDPRRRAQTPRRCVKIHAPASMERRLRLPAIQPRWRRLAKQEGASSRRQPRAGLPQAARSMAPEPRSVSLTTSWSRIAIRSVGVRCRTVTVNRIGAQRPSRRG